MFVAWSITWLLVRTRPFAEMIIPVPSAVSPLYLSDATISTRPGLTFFATLSGLSGADREPLPDALSRGPGTSPGGEAPDETPDARGGGWCPPTRHGAPGPVPPPGPGNGQGARRPPGP